MDSGVAEEPCIPSSAGKRGRGVRAAFPGRGPPDLSLDPGRRERGTKPAGVSVEVQAAGGCREHVLTSQGTQRRGRAVVTASESPPYPPPPSRAHAYALILPSARPLYLSGHGCVMQRLWLLQSPPLCGPPCVYLRCVACSRGERFLVCLFAGQLLQFGGGWSCALCLEGWTHVSVVQPSCS